MLTRTQARFREISTRTRIVATYGDIPSKWLSMSTPRPCRWNCSMVTPPNRYAPSSTRAGRQVANVVSASAIQPLPAVSPSTHRCA